MGSGLVGKRVNTQLCVPRPLAKTCIIAYHTYSSVCGHVMAPHTLRKIRTVSFRCCPFSVAAALSRIVTAFGHRGERSGANETNTGALSTSNVLQKCAFLWLKSGACGENIDQTRQCANAPSVDAVNK